MTVSSTTDYPLKHSGTYAVAATGLITNKDDLAGKLLREGASFSEMRTGGVNSVELVAQLINRAKTR